jgi:hypothetical protein
MKTEAYLRAKELDDIFNSEQRYTLGEVQAAAERLTGRPVMTHELARPLYLVAEILGAPRHDAFEVLKEIRT